VKRWRARKSGTVWQESFEQAARGPPATLREVAEELGVSHERVRQLQRDAEHKLRSYAKIVLPAKPPRGLSSVLTPHGYERSTEREASGRERKTA
jgi:hypothetical protein